MNKVLVSLAALIVFSSVAHAVEVCGTLGSHIVVPNCDPGQPCPMFEQLQYDLTTAEGTKLDVNCSTSDLLTQFGDLKGQKVCADGTLKDGALMTTTISAQK